MNQPPPAPSPQQQQFNQPPPPPPPQQQQHLNQPLHQGSSSRLGATRSKCNSNRCEWLPAYLPHSSNRCAWPQGFHLHNNNKYEWPLVFRHLSSSKCEWLLAPSKFNYLQESRPSSTKQCCSNKQQPQQHSSKDLLPALPHLATRNRSACPQVFPRSSTRRC